MTTTPWRASVRLIAAPLILAVLVTGQAAGADASPARHADVQQSSSPDVVELQQAQRETRLTTYLAAQENLARVEREAAERARAEAAARAAIGQRIVAAAAAQAGKPYVYGATGPRAFDCSGLTAWAYAAVGIRLPRTSGAQAAAMTRVSDPMPGDLVFMPGHIGIYAGNNKMWHAPHSGDVVKLATIWTSRVTYGRIR